MRAKPILGRLPPGWASYAVFVAFLLLAAYFHLGPPVLAALFSYTILDMVHRGLKNWMPKFYARWISLMIFVGAVVIGAWLAARFVQQSLTAIPEILERATPRILEISARYGVDLPFEDVEGLRIMIADWLKENARNITHAGGVLTREFFHALIGMFIAALGFMAPGSRDHGENLYGVLSRGFVERTGRFMASFERVIGAQILISGINTALTAAFLIYFDFPKAHFLILATFFLGMLPVVGNLVSNTIIVSTALTLSPTQAVFSLAFLVVIHKGEYFLNSRIIGASIHAPMWQTLLGILLGEVLFGIPGIVLAPAVLHYVRRELTDIPWKARSGPKVA